jgi:hypothetical protein
MAQRLLAAIVATAPLLFLGCHHASQAGGQSVAVARPPTVPPLPQADPAPLTPVVERSVTAVPPPPEYRRLTAAMCQELAVRNCVVANVLEDAAAEPGGGRKKHCGIEKQCGSGAGEARTRALLYAADEARNRAAGEALEMYYKLVAAEAGAQVGRAAESDLKNLMKTARAAVAAGQKEPPGTLQLEAQLAEVSADVIRAEGGARELNHGLKALLGLPQDRPEQFWPDPPEVGQPPASADEAVRVGLANRPDLLLLRTLAGSGDPDSAQVASQALGGVNPLLSGPASLLSGSPSLKLRVVAACLGLNLPTPEQLQHVRQHVAELLAGRERQAEAEIRAAIERTVSLAAQAKTHADLADGMRTRVADLEKSEAAGRGDAAELATARAAFRKASGNVVTAATNYQVAVAKLRQAQGLLVREVGNPSCGELPR